MVFSKNLFQVLGILILCNSCVQKSAVAPETGSLLDNTDPRLLYQSIRNLKNSVSDTGTLGNLKLNYPDSVFKYIGNQQQIEEYFNSWIGSEGNAKLLIWRQNLVYHALKPDYYHMDYIARCHNQIENRRWTEKGSIPHDSLARLLLLSADAVLGLYYDLSQGRTLPVHSMSTYILPKRKLPVAVRNLLFGKTFLFLDSAAPKWNAYNKLGKEYRRLSELTDSFPEKTFEPGRTVKPEQNLSESELLALGNRLRLHGYLTIHDSLLRVKRVYDEDLTLAVTAFQIDNELKSDGTLGPKTVGLLNTRRDEMMKKTAAALERWRWLGNLSRTNKVVVNIAANRAEAWRNDSLMLFMNTCSGEPRGAAYYRKLEESKKPKSRILPPDNLETPLFSAKITHFVVNPTWFVPRNILVKEMLPEIRKNPLILKKLGYVIRNSKGEEVDPYSINWDKVTPGKVNFTIQQTTGEENSLGQVVIHFPNPYSIFMHDTPHKWVFGLDERHVSHGCIRLEKPFAMVEFLTSFNKKNNYDKALIAAGLPPEHDTVLLRKWKQEKKKLEKDSGYKFKPEQDKYFRLDSSLPVYLVYFNAWISSTGKVVYSNDSYKYDRKTLMEMDRPGRVRRRLPEKKETKSKNSD